MNSEKFSEDYYLNSIKKFFIPFIILNIIAIILGASAVNIINIVIRSKAASNTKNLTAIAGQDLIHLDSPITLETKETKRLGQELSESNMEASELGTVIPKIKPPTNETNLIQEPNSPSIEKQFQYDQAIETEKEDSKLFNMPRSSIYEQPKDSSATEVKREPQVRHLILPTLNITSEVLDIPIVNGDWDISHIEDNSGILDGFANNPDESGPLVIAAHATTNWPIAGPFAELRNMNLGDPIVFQLGNTEYIYEINRFLKVSTSDVDVLRKNGEDGIVLVTCNDYNFFTGRYGLRLVVYGDLVETREIVAQTSN